MHRKSGLWFYFAMLGVCFTAIWLSATRSNDFLLHLGIFSLYQTWVGRRAIAVKTLRAATPDYILLVIASANGILMLLSANMLLVFFGSIQVYMAVSHWIRCLKVLRGGELPQAYWLRVHIGMMTGGFIASVTAFLVVNHNTSDSVLPVWLTWLLPTLLLLPVIIYWISKYTGNGKKNMVKVK